MRRLSSIALPLAVLGAILAFLIAPVLAWQWFALPFLGLFLEQNNVVSTTGRSTWSGRQAGIAYPEQLIALDDQALQTLAALPRLLEGYQPGDTVALTLRAPDDGQRVVVVPLSRFALRDLVAYFIVPYLIGLAYLFIGLWVLYAGGDRPAIWSFALFCTLVALVMGTFFDLHTTHVLVPFWSVALPFVGAALGHMALTFPKELASGRSWFWTAAIYAVAAALSLYALLTCANLAAPWSYVSVLRLAWLLGVLGLLFLMLSQLYRVRTAASPIHRQQSRTVLLGGIFAFGPLATWMLLEGLHISARFYATLFLPFLVIFPLAAGYAILRYRLRDLDHILSRGGAHVSLALLLIGLYFLLITLLGDSLWPDLSAGDPLILTLFILFTLIVFQPLRRYAERIVDRVLIRGPVDYGQALGEFSRQLTAVLDLEQVLELVMQQLQGTLQPTRLAAFLQESKSGVYKPVWTHGDLTVNALPRFDEGGMLIRQLRCSREPLYFPTEDLIPDSLRDECGSLLALGLVACVPLHTQEQLIGCFALGPASVERLYSRKELAFLASLANQSALAIENAHLYTELQRRLVELERTQAQLIRSEKMASLGRLAADIAHEIGNPLAYVTGYLDVLWEDSPPDAPERHYLHLAQEQVERIGTLVQQLLQISRPSRQRREATDINEVIWAVLALIEKKLAYQNIELIAELDPDLPFIMADAGQMQQIVLNLVINAIHAMPEGGSLRLATFCQGETLVVQVEDTGEGIPPENMERIFEPFFTTKQDGTGLGLAITYNIVTGHGGDIEVQSKVGWGTCFTIRLPVPPQFVELEGET